MDYDHMTTEELHAANVKDTVAKLRSLHIRRLAQRPSKRVAEQEWDRYIAFLRSRYQSYSDADIAEFVREATRPVTNMERIQVLDPALYVRLRHSEAAAAEKKARSPEQKRRDRKGLALGFALIAAFWIVVSGGLWLLLRGGDDPDRDRDRGNDYYPGMEVCDVPPAAWGEPITCSELP